MKKLMVSIFDNKAESWSFPVQADNKATAIRMFADLVKDDRTLVGQHPSDFDLYVVGEFDVTNGCISTHFDRLSNGSDFKPASQE